MMPRGWRFGIQTRILLVAFALGSLFVAYVAYTAVRESAREREVVREQMRLVATVAGSRFDDHIGDVTQLLNVLTGTVGTDRATIAANDLLLQSVAMQMPANVGSVAVWGADGSNLGSSDAGSPEARRSVVGRPFFIEAMNGVGLKTEAPLRTGNDASWSAVFAMPVVRGGSTVAIVSATTRLLTLPALLARDGDLPTGAVVSVVGGDGRFLARSLEAERFIGQPAPFDGALQRQRLAEGRGSTAFTGPDGVERIYGYARMRSLPWLAYVGVPVDDALAAAHARTRTSVLVGVVVLGGGLLIAAWVAARIAKPLRQLGADAELIGQGRFEHRTRVRGTSEVGVLAHTFNRMAEALQDRIVAGRRSEEQLKLALEGSEQALFDWDIAANRIYYSAKSAELRGDEPKELVTAPEELQSLVHPDDLAGLLAAIKAAVRGETTLYECEYRIRRADGSWMWQRSRGRVVERDAAGRALRMVGTDSDITKRKLAESELRHRAEFDQLTGLPNRALFNDRLAMAMERAERSGKRLALLFVDIDHFKVVNDTRGHEAGDELLKVAAARLSSVVRTTDTVARLAGDEFTVILEEVGSLADAELVAGKLVEALRVPMRVGDSSLIVSTSVGLAMLEAGERDAVSLLRRADEALYEAKRRGRDRYAMRLVTSA